MKNKKFFDLKFLNKYYIKHKEKELKSLEAKKEELLGAVEYEKKISSENKIQLEKEHEENIRLKQQYHRIKNSLIERGIILDIENNNYGVKEWDNLELYRKASKYMILSKKKEIIYILDHDMCSIVEEISKESFSLSIIAIRVNSKLIKAQIRFIKKQ